MSFLVISALLGICTAFNTSDYAGGSRNGFYTYDEIVTWTKNAAKTTQYATASTLTTSTTSKPLPYIKLASSSKMQKVDVFLSAETSTYPVHVNTVMYYFYGIVDYDDLEFTLSTRNIW